MDNLPRYYTPTNEEFRVGFEYEFLSLNGYSTQKFEYGSNGNSNSFQDLKEFIKEKSIRVKYLDSKDIEDLGFLYDDKDKSFWSKDKSICLFTDDNIKNLYIIQHKTDKMFSPNTIKIYIKNKSELEYLLRYQLKL